MNVFVIGVGLIGGSIVTDIKAKFQEATIFGVDRNSVHLDKALALGFIDHKADFNELSKADVVVLAIPVDKAKELVVDVLDTINDSCLIFDVGSTKEGICTNVANHPKRKCFLAAHPIAGTEFSGPTAALKGLFQGKSNIICEAEKTGEPQLKLGEEIFKRLGMKLSYMDAASHDKHIAYVSHLSHVSSFMLGKTVIEKEKDEKTIFDMAGSGFASTVRLAKSSPAMWTPIFKQNKKHVLEALGEFIENLNGFKKLIEEGDDTRIFQEMEDTNRIKEILKGIEK